MEVILNLVKVLYIEDDMTTAKFIVDFLHEYGFSVEHTDTITMALSYLNQNEFDIILLDLNLPDFSGFELLKTANIAQIPIMVISALNDTHTKVQAFRYGASDYMVKPIDLLEMEARIWAHLRQRGLISKPKQKDIFEIKNNQLYLNNNIIDLTPTEFNIFGMLLKNKNRVLSREKLYAALSSISSPRTLDYHIKNIREKIEQDPKNPKYLKMEYGVGYKLICYTS